jgi:hypothetical protein
MIGLGIVSQLEDDPGFGRFCRENNGEGEGKK